jgi:Enoyl-CoA hydratase/carnithine racemase
MDCETILLEKKGNVATLTLNRPEKLNAVTEQLFEELLYAFDKLAKDDTMRVLVITGSGRAFSAGLDLDWARSMVEQRKRGEKVYDVLTKWVTKLHSALIDIPYPVLAAINGAAAGWGATMPLSCDIRIAAEDARISLPFASSVGITPEMNSTYMLPRVVGMGKACELIFTGKTITGKEAKEIGLVNDAVPLAKLQTVTSELAQTIARGAPMAMRLAKKGLYQGLDTDRYRQSLWEEATIHDTFQSEDHAEAVEAFLAKRKPIFKGR